MESLTCNSLSPFLISNYGVIICESLTLFPMSKHWRLAYTNVSNVACESLTFIAFYSFSNHDTKKKPTVIFDFYFYVSHDILTLSNTVNIQILVMLAINLHFALFWIFNLHRRQSLNFSNVGCKSLTFIVINFWSLPLQIFNLHPLVDFESLNCANIGH